MPEIPSVMPIPGPRHLPILGWLPLLLRLAFRPLSTLEGLQRQYGNFIRIGYGPSPAYLIFDPAYNRQVLRDPSAFYSFDLDISPLPLAADGPMSRLITGLPFTNGPRHATHRAEMLPYFHRKFIARYQAGCLRAVEDRMAIWIPGNILNLRTEMEQLAISMAIDPVLGTDLRPYGERLGTQLEETTKALFSPLALIFPIDLPGTPFRLLRKSARRMEAVVREVILQRKAAGLDGDDLLSMMIRLHENDPQAFSESDLLGNTMTMFRGGYNPNGMALYWSIFLLSRHPVTLERLRREFDQVLEGRNPGAEDLDRLVFLDCVIKETMRLFPAGTWTARLSLQAAEIGGYPVPERSWLVMSPFVTHRLPEVFPEPRKFRPERWLSIHPSSYEFLPFSAGPRYCLGAALAMLQLKTALSIILQHFDFCLVPGARVDCSGMNSIRPKNGLPMRISLRGYPPPDAPLAGNIRAIVDLV